MVDACDAPSEEIIAAANCVDQSDRMLDAPSPSGAAEIEGVDGDELQQKLAFQMALNELGGENGIADLPAYRTVDGQDLPAGRSPLLSDASIRRFLVQARGDSSLAAEAVVGTLSWRRRVFPEEGPQDKALSLISENRRFRELGPNSDGDHVYALDFCFGKFIDADVELVDCMRMVLIGVERALAAADSAGHPQVVLVMFGGPPPVQFARVCYRVLERHYPERLRRAVVYPVPHVWARVVSACMYFLNADTRKKIAIVSTENDVVELARLTGPDQLPENWRGGIETVDEVHRPDKSLLSSILLKYLNPFHDSGDAIAKELEVVTCIGSQ